jgi:hypothetical protein
MRAKEDLDLSVQNQRTLLDDDIDVLEDNILELMVAISNQGDKGLSYLGTVVPDHIVTGHVVHKLHNDANG